MKPFAPHLAAVEAEFARNFSERGEVGAGVCIWAGGREVLSLAGGVACRKSGRPWTADTPVLVWSTTKGMTAGCLLHALAAAKLHLFVPVAEILPEFSEHGKWGITLGELFSHQGGVAALDHPVDAADRDAVVAALCAQPRLWTEGHGYHPRTLGYLYDEILRRLTGLGVGEYWQKHFAGPLGLRAWIGAPEHVIPDVADILQSREKPSPDDASARAILDPSTLAARAFASPRGVAAAWAMNSPDHRRACYPSFGGIATAKALAAYYAYLITTPMLPWMTRRLVDGPDLVLGCDTAFSAGFMLDPLDPAGRKKRQVFGPRIDAFGHPGAGGSIAFADPENGIAFAYVMNQMGPGVLPNIRARSLIRALYAI